MVSFIETNLVRLYLTLVVGRIAHIVYMILCLINNIFACTNMLLGASAVIASMYAYLIPSPRA